MYRRKLNSLNFEIAVIKDRRSESQRVAHITVAQQSTSVHSWRTKKDIFGAWSYNRMHTVPLLAFLLAFYFSRTYNYWF